MFTSKDIQFRNVYVINCITEKELRVSNGELLLEDKNDNRTLTKLPFQKILALFIVGHIHITTPLIEKCKQNNVAIVVMKLSLRPVFFWSNSAEANYLVRKKQYEFTKDDLSIAKHLVENKINNQMLLLKRTRRKDALTINGLDMCKKAIETIPYSFDYKELMGLEGIAAKSFFAAYFQDYNWSSRKPRTKSDYLNTLLDIGYTYLFNFIECFVRMFGFDIYVGVYHRLWFKRKSLICDIIEPFRCIVDKIIRTALNRNQFSQSDFELYKGEFHLKRDKNKDYSIVFFNALVEYKMVIFQYVQKYYRCFMRNKEMNSYPIFKI